jgi:hypothetical protein
LNELNELIDQYWIIAYYAVGLFPS